MSNKKPQGTLLDLVVLAGVLLFVGYLVYRLFFSLNYAWNWSIIPTYLVKEVEGGGWAPNLLLEGLITTIKLSVWGTILALGLGLIVGLMRVSPRLFFLLVGRSYIETIRNTPPLVLVFILYFFVSDQLLSFLGVEDLLRSSSAETQQLVSWLFAEPSLIVQFLSGVLTLGLFQGAYIAEIIRAGIQAIDTGQWEAGASLGLGRWKLMRLVILPQATKIMLPPLANEFINTIKWSSIVSIISIQELTFQGLQVMASTQATIEIWLTISLMYLILCLSLSLLVRRLELYLSQSERVMTTYQQTGP